MSSRERTEHGAGVVPQTAEGPQAMLELSCARDRVAFIFNPASGPDDADARRSQVETLLEDAGLSCSVCDTSPERGAGPLAEEAVADGMERVLVSGGDGSVMEAAGALVGREVALGIVPGGTGNLFALNLEIPLDAEEAVRLALTGRPTPVDVGYCNGTPFVLMAGMGWDAKMIHDADQGMKSRFGILAYFWAAVKNMAHPMAVYRITIDGRVLRRRAKSVLVANLGRITGGLPVIPDTDPSDGRLEVAVLSAENVRDFLGLLWSALRGKIHEDPHLERHRGREILIETHRPQPLQLDGNPAGETTRAEFSVRERALLVVLPDGTK